MARKYSGFDKQLIGAEWKKGGGGGKLADINPYNGEKLLSIKTASKGDVDAAFKAAQDAQESWARVPFIERAQVFINAAGILDARRDEFIDWLIDEVGSTKIKAQLEVALVRQVLVASSGLAARAKGYIMPSTIPGQESRVYREPVGVVGMISPWNFPLMLSMRTVAPALALGNSVVLKPSSDSPVTGGSLICKLFEEAGLPSGVISAVIGRGGDIGDYFVEHDIPGIISFTGSTPVGKGIGNKAFSGRWIKRVALELGGNAPFVVLDDADVDEAVHALVVGRFLHQGQICMSTNRAIVDASIYDTFVKKLAARIKSLKVGDPHKDDTAVTSLINEGQADKVRRMIDRAVKDGAKIAVGKKSKGTLVYPHLITEVTPKMQIATDEIFGPVLPVLRAKNESGALKLANMTEYGLSSAVFTGNLERGVEFARKLRVGMTHVNGLSVDDQPTAPFGGEKNSGIGRFNDEWAINEFTRAHWITVQHTPLAYPF